MRRLDAASIPFLFILGDHDRLAVGGSFAGAVDAVDRLRRLAAEGIVIECDTDGVTVGSEVVVYGVPATGVDLASVRTGYTLDGWKDDQLELTPSPGAEGRVLCLHETVSPPRGNNGHDAQTILETVIPEIDLLALGHEHSRPLNGSVGDVPIRYAGPPMRISDDFQDEAVSPSVNVYRFSRTAEVENVRVPVTELPD